MAMLTREQILAAKDREKRELVEIPEWGGSVFVHEISAYDRASFELIGAKLKAGVTVSVKEYMDAKVGMCVSAMRDENGQPLFTSKDVAALCQKSSEAIDTVFSTLLKLSGVDKKVVEEIEKNFETTQGEDSPSA